MLALVHGFPLSLTASLSVTFNFTAVLIFSGKAIPKGTETYQLELPERPLPVSEAIQDDWKGGVIPFCCCSISGYHEGILSESNIYQIARNRKIPQFIYICIRLIRCQFPIPIYVNTGIYK